MSTSGTGQDPQNQTRKQRRETARQERRDAEAAQASAQQRRQRLIQLGTVLGAVIVIIVVIIVAVGGGKGSGEQGPAPAPNTTAANEARKTVENEINGIPQAGNRLGNPNAPVTMQYFGDLECPICKEFTLGALPDIIRNDVRTGKLKIEYRSMSTASGNAERLGAEPTGTFNSQQVAAYAAGRQNKAWYYIELFYHEQGEEDSGYVKESYIQGIAQQVPGLNLTKWTSDRNDKALENEVFEDERAATKAGFTGTPSFMLGKSGGALSPYTTTGTFQEAGPFEEEIAKLAS